MNWQRFSNIKKSDLAIFQSAPYPRIRRMLINILKQFLPILFLIDPKNKVNGCALLFEKFHSDLTLNISLNQSGNFPTVPRIFS